MSVERYNVLEDAHQKRNSVEFKLQKYLGASLPIVNTLEDLIKELHKVFEDDSVNIELVSYLMKTYKSSHKEWKKYAKFDRYR